MQQCACTELIGTVPCWQLIALAGGLGVAWAFTLQLVLNLTLFRTIANAALSKTSSSVEDRAKLIQQLSELSTYAWMLGLGLAYAPHTPCAANSPSSDCARSHASSLTE